WIVRSGTVRPYEGDVDSYRAECLAERRAVPEQSRAKSKVRFDAKPTPQDLRRRAAQMRSALAPLKKAVADAEAEIERIAKRMQAIDSELADSALYMRDSDHAQALTRERGELRRSHESAELQWFSATEAYERAQVDAHEA